MGYLIVFFLVVAITSFGMFLRKLVLKGRLERGLGRKVEDNELTSITAWMETTPESGQAPPAMQSPRQKRGDLISLVLGVTGLALILLSIFSARQLHDTSFFAFSYFLGIILVIAGLPLSLIALVRARKFPAVYGKGRRALGGVLANLALGAVVLLLTGAELFWGRSLNAFLRPDAYQSDILTQTRSTSTTSNANQAAVNQSPQKKRFAMLPAIEDWFKARKQSDVMALAMGDKKDQLVIGTPSLKRPAADALAKEFAAQRGKELIAAGFANTFLFTDQGKVVGSYEFKSIDVLARETALTLTELWFLSQQKVTTKATLDPADDTKLIITSAAFTEANQNMLTIEFSIMNSKHLKGLGFANDFTATNGQQSWAHQLN